MPLRPQPVPLVAGLPETVPFVGPENQERSRGRSFRARLGANENGFGPSPRAVEAMQGAAAGMWKYCDPDNFELKEAIAARLGVASENVVIGEGVDGLLGLAVRIYAGHGAAVVTSLGAYPTFNFHVAGFGGRLVAVPYRADREDLEALLAAVKREKAPLVYLSNPDNPMGSWWSAAEVQHFIEALPADTMLLLDEAYGELAPEGTMPAIEVERPNVIRLRTFSKAYGLAGIRLGYAVGERAVIRGFDKVRNHYGINRMAQAAGVAALADQAYLQDICARVERARRSIGVIARDNGLAPLASAANFVAIDCGGDGAYAARVMQALISRDVFVRKPGVPVLDRCIRISAGPDEELAILARELPGALGDARGN